MSKTKAETNKKLVRHIQVVKVNQYSKKVFMNGMWYYVKASAKTSEGINPRDVLRVIDGTKSNKK